MVVWCCGVFQSREVWVSTGIDGGAFILRVEDGGICAVSGRGALGRNRLSATTAGAAGRVDAWTCRAYFMRHSYQKRENSFSKPNLESGFLSKHDYNSSSHGVCTPSIDTHTPKGAIEAQVHLPHSQERGANQGLARHLPASTAHRNGVPRQYSSQ